MSGSIHVMQAGVYGIEGTPAPGNAPGARTEMFTWTDSGGDLWLFGGTDSEGECMNDLWKFDPSTNEWAWMGGAKAAPGEIGCGQSGVYGAKGVAAAQNIPGGRLAGGSWVDTQGHFWLFGGYGLDINGHFNGLNDLWEFDPAAGQWTWMGGSGLNAASGVYGIMGKAAPGNTPGARGDAATWVDDAGNFYLFGGTGIDSAGNSGTLNDLWKFDPKAMEWTWMSGSNQVDNARPYRGFAPVYGTLGTPADTSAPGSRKHGAGWADRDGKLWLFGGVAGDEYRFSAALAQSVFNDLWEFDPSTSQWTWWGGSDNLTCLMQGVSGECVVDGVAGTYGALGTMATTNSPGSRSGPITWIDQNRDVWLFGGLGFDSTGQYTQLNDLWQFRFRQKASAQLTSNADEVFQNNAVILSAAVKASTGIPTGSVTFFDGTKSLGSGTLSSQGVATLTLDDLAIGSHALSASYSGDLLDFPATSGQLTQQVVDFRIASVNATDVTVSPGGEASFALTVAPVAPATTLPSDVTLAATGGPVGASYSFSPAVIAHGAGASNLVLIVSLRLHQAVTEDARPRKSTPVWWCCLLLPITLCWPSTKTRTASWRALVLLVTGTVATFLLTGCASFTWTPHTYNVTVTGTAGALSHSSTLTLSVK